MKRHRTHQIDDLAQRIFKAALPPTWVPNEQHKDYGKDYLVEIGEDNGDLTGSSFYVQLKGQEKAEFTADRSQVKFSLESKYAAYYLDKIKDLPVFLVVVDVNARKGWYHFLQPGLETNRSWRKHKSVTVHLPAANDLSDTPRLRQAVESAKQTMRLLHPESIQEAVAAHKRRVHALDPRFNVRVSLVNETPIFELLPLESVSGQIEFKGGKKVQAKASDLLDKGALVEFKPGEVKITGSPLFEQFERTGGAMQAALYSPAAAALICRDGEGRELRRLSDVPGRLTGGMKESWFEGRLESSPLAIKIGPMGKGVGGSANVNWTLANWNGQKLLHLAFFDKLLGFITALATSATTDVECLVNGNTFFTVNVRFDKSGFAEPFSQYMILIDKARKVAARFGINPTWTAKAFDADEWDTAARLHAVFFEGGSVEKMPNVTLNVRVEKNTFRPDVLAQMKESCSLYLVPTSACTLLGEKIEVGPLTHEYTAVKVVEKKVPQKKGTKGRNRCVVLQVKGCKDTVRRIRPGQPQGQ